MIPQDTINTIRDRADIVSVISERIQLKKAGANFMGHCPFHGEKTPSFSVSPTRQAYHCFGCGAHGDVIAFLMEHDGKDFREAARDLGEELGIKVEDEEDPSKLRASAARSQEQRATEKRILSKIAQAADHYREQLDKSTRARAYAQKRALTPEMIDLYGIGYSPASSNALSIIFEKYATDPDLVECGLVIEPASDERRPRYDRFRDRLMFPIRNTTGQVVGFGARVLPGAPDDAPKYLNSPEYSLFIKHKILYGLHEARSAIRRAGRAYVTEGYMDVVAMATHGIPNAVAALGTALTEDHLRTLLRFTNDICFLFDADKAGQTAAWKACVQALPFCEPSSSFSFLTLPGAKDPDEFLKEHGRESFEASAKQLAKPLSSFMLDTLETQISQPLSSMEGKARFLSEAKALIQKIPAHNPMREMMLDEVARRTGQGPTGSARRRLEQAARVTSRGTPTSQAHSPSPATETRSLWQRLLTATTLAPVAAVAAAPVILPLLDEQSEEEGLLGARLQMLQETPTDQLDESDVPLDEKQTAADILANAPQLISRQRDADLHQVLESMRASGQISEQDYLRQIMAS